MTRQEASSLKYLDSAWIKNGNGWDRFVMMVRKDEDHAYGQVWDFSGDAETPRLRMEVVDISTLHKERV